MCWSRSAARGVFGWKSPPPSPSLSSYFPPSTLPPPTLSWSICYFTRVGIDQNVDLVSPFCAMKKQDHYVYLQLTCSLTLAKKNAITHLTEIAQNFQSLQNRILFDMNLLDFAQKIFRKVSIEITQWPNSSLKIMPIKWSSTQSDLQLVCHRLKNLPIGRMTNWEVSLPIFSDPSLFPPTDLSSARTLS